MKILHLCSIGITAKKLLRPQVDYLLSRGLNVEIACSPDLEAEQLRQEGYIVRPIFIDRKISPFSNFKTLIQLVKLFQENQYDLVHVHTSVASVLGRIAAKLAGVKRIVYTAHGFPFHDRSPYLEYHLYLGIEKFCALFTDLILTQSYEDFTTACKQGLHSVQGVRHLNNGVDSSLFCRDRLNPIEQQQLRQSLGIPQTADFIIGTIGRLIREKGFTDLVDAIALLLPQFPNLHVLIIGGQLSTDSEPLQAELIQQATHLGIADQILFTGYREDIPQLLGLLDIFTLPTYFGEGVPRSILEAMSMGLPIVATDIRGCREAVASGENGFIVPPKDSEALANALAELLANRDLRQTFGAKSRQRVEAEYDEHFVFQRLVEAYQDLGIVFPEPSAIDDSPRAVSLVSLTP
ncbi:glycosyltransferase family 4 protein [Geitlerinema calcuttense]|uniref:Glycosyltransferase family 4 protein n=1 Tax=Geitlerinema calcuttense NRMC-F 0142 TaxID=2922238 RepID=A0ABT7LYG6_9CYAN|nr:glycosyltransferase family 4 protein [Geitlerinema calcuttense]MDL5057056.1 glycosyltransferase family 4 protein [Geitlerinema calcuttense NRMC-F 0142]